MSDGRPTTYDMALHAVRLRTRGRFTQRGLVRELVGQGVMEDVAKRAVRELIAGGALEVRLDPDAKQRRGFKRVFLGARSVEGALKVAARPSRVCVRNAQDGLAPPPTPHHPPKPGDRDDKGRVLQPDGRSWRYPDDAVPPPRQTITGPPPGTLVLVAEGLRPAAPPHNRLDPSSSPWRDAMPLAFR